MKKVIFLAILAISACAGTPFKWSEARKIEAGMSKLEITSILGAPTRVATTQNGTRYVWVWVNTMTASSRSLVVDFDSNGKVIKAPPIPDEFQD
jgi:outer membrane protein assembly factor BamE (lipoprotein component of BamABCDE complex)